MTGGGGEKKRIQYCSDSSGTILYLWALQGHLGRCLIDPSLQDNVIIPHGFFKYIQHVGCAINLHSIINSGLIPGGQNLSNRQTVFFLLVDPMDKERKDPATIDLEAPHLAQYMHKAWKKRQNTVYWVDINLPLKKGLKFYQTRSNAVILHETLPAYCIPKVVRMETGEVIYEKVYASSRPPPKISLKHDWMKDLGSKVARQSEREVARQARSSQSSQPNPNPDHDRTRKPVVCPQRGAPHSQQIDTRSFCEDVMRHDRTGKPVVCCDENHERPMLNEVDIDFRIPGLPHSVVKQADNYRVRELVKKIDNHPHRQSLQRVLQQNNAYNPFCEKSKKMMKDMGNVELFELFETDPKTQCKECLLYWNLGIICCTCGHLLKESEANRGAIQCTLDLLPIPNYVIKKGRPHDHRYRKTTAQREHYVANNLIHHRFVNDPEFRASQLEHDRDEEVWIKMDELAQKDFRRHMTQAEYFRYRRNWWNSLNNDRTSGRLKNRSDFNEALSTLHHLHQESRGRQLRLVPFRKYQYWHQSSSSSSSWWQWSDSWWSS